MKAYEIIGAMPEADRKRLFDALAGTADVAEARRVLAAEGLELSDADVQECLEYQEKRRAALSDEELSDIAGGRYYDYEEHDSPSAVTYIAKVGDVVEVSNGWGGTQQCRITDVKLIDLWGSYHEEYYMVPLETHWYLPKRKWIRRDVIEIPGT